MQEKDNKNIIFTGFMGTGKTTVCRAVLERDSQVTLSVSHTTRKPREGERHGERARRRGQTRSVRRPR